MYDEIFNPEDFERESKDNSEGSFQEELDIEIPTPKEGPSLDEMIRKYGLTIIEFSVKSIKHDYEVKKK
jgi:hypothetical protein